MQHKIGNSSSKISRRDFLKISAGLSIGSALNFSSLRKQEAGDKSKPNILLVVFDTLSALHMSLYGYRRRTTPNLERLADRATVYHRHYAAGNFTTPGTASLLTGAYPWSHRALNIHGTVADSFVSRSIFHSLPDGYTSFAYSHNPLVNYFLNQFQTAIDQWVKASDLSLVSSSYSDRFFQTDYHRAYDAELAAFRGRYVPTSFLLSRLERLLRYFYSTSIGAKFQAQFPRGVPNLFDYSMPGYIFFTIEQALDWLQNKLLEQTNPFMGYIHLFPPHYPYATRREFVDIFADNWNPEPKPDHFFAEGHSDEYLSDARRAYDEYIAYVDAEFGRLYQFLDSSRILENTLLIFTSDHGEMFERDIWAHTTPVLYEPLLRVPLLIWVPDQMSRQDVLTPTSCIDLLPTLASLLGRPAPEWCEGEVLPPFGGQSGNAERSLFAVEAKNNAWQSPLNTVTLAMIRGQYKLVYYLGYDGYSDQFELYDLQNDPQELVNLYLSQPAIFEPMRDELLKKLNQVNQPYRPTR